MTHSKNRLCIAGAVIALSMLVACNRQPEGTSDTFDQSQATTTSSIESVGTTGATDYNNDSTHQGTNYNTSPDTTMRGNRSAGSLGGSSHNR